MTAILIKATQTNNFLSNHFYYVYDLDGNLSSTGDQTIIRGGFNSSNILLVENNVPDADIGFGAGGADRAFCSRSASPPRAHKKKAFAFTINM